jgi:hypothetical protein
MPKVQNMSVFVLSRREFICIASATFRVVKLGVDGRGKTTRLEPKCMLIVDGARMLYGYGHYISVTNKPSSKNHSLLHCFRCVHSLASQ